MFLVHALLMYWHELWRGAFATRASATSGRSPRAERNMLDIDWSNTTPNFLQSFLSHLSDQDCDDSSETKNVSSILFEESTRGERIKRKPVVVRSVRAQVLKSRFRQKKLHFVFQSLLEITTVAAIKSIFTFPSDTRRYFRRLLFSVYQVEASSSQMAKK